MGELIERLRMQSQHDDSVEEEAIARIEQLEAYNAEHQSVCQLQEQLIAVLEDEVKALKTDITYWDNARLVYMMEQQDE